jgi:hypothetical protein
MSSSATNRGSNDIEGAANQFVVVPSSVSKGLVAKSGLPAGGSQDMRQLLVPPAVNHRPPSDELHDYRPLDSIEWVVDIEFDGDPVLP